MGFVFPQVPWGCFAACGTEGLHTGREGGVGHARQAAGMVAASGQGRAIDKGPLGPWCKSWVKNLEGNSSNTSHALISFPLRPAPPPLLQIQSALCFEGGLVEDSGGGKFFPPKMICVNLNPSVTPWGTNMTGKIVHFRRMNLQSLLLREILMYRGVRTRILNLTASIYYSCWVICYYCTGTPETRKSAFPSRSYCAPCVWRQWKSWNTEDVVGEGGTKSLFLTF